MKDKVPGGLAKGKSLKDIAKHHKIPTQHIINALKKGIEVEKEHTTDESIAKEIAMDHLWEDPKYYNKLATIEKIDEAKQVGILYHFTSLNNVISIIKDNSLKVDGFKPPSRGNRIKSPSKIFPDGSTGSRWDTQGNYSSEQFEYNQYSISFTRNKNFHQQHRIGVSTEVRIVIDGNKLSEKYHIEPFNFQTKSSKIGGAYEEQEERITFGLSSDGEVEDFDKYVISYDVFLDEWESLTSMLKTPLLENDALINLIGNNPKVKAYYNNKELSKQDALDFMFSTLDKYATRKKIAETINLELTQLVKEIKQQLDEGKNVGNLYHFTSPVAAQLILKQNRINAYGMRRNKFYISFTRNKDLYKDDPEIGGDSIRLVLDGNKISDNYKLRPYDDYNGVTSKKTNFEAEETIYLDKNSSKALLDLDKYLISIDIIKPLNLSIDIIDFFKNYKKHPVKVMNHGKLISIDDIKSIRDKEIQKSKEEYPKIANALNEYHNQKELNPNLWENNQLKPKIKEGLLKVAQFFISKVKDISLDVKDIILTGSSANYGWTQYSDIDLHVLLDFSTYKDPEMAKKYFEQLKNTWNKEFDLKIGNNEIEIYFQDINEPHTAAGVYSIQQDKWLKKPQQESVEVSDEEIQKKAQPFKDKINQIESLQDPQEALGDIELLKEKIRRFRKCGLEKGGEYSVENLAFKELRNSGYLEKLTNIKKDDEQKELSSYISEGKNIGLLYHFTTVKNAIKILEDDEIKATALTVSLTRNKNFYKSKPLIGGVEVRLSLNGNKISDNYKLKPYDYMGGWKKGYRKEDYPTTGLNKLVLNKVAEFEAEERIYGNLKNLNKYLISIDIIDPDDITNIEGVEYFENYDKFPVRFFDKYGKLIPNYKEKHQKQVVEAKEIEDLTEKEKIQKIKKYIKLLTQFLLEKGYNIKPLPKIKFIYSSLVNANSIVGKTGHYDRDSRSITLYARNRGLKDCVKTVLHEFIHHIQYNEDRIGDISTTDITKDKNLKKIEAEAYLKGGIIFREFEEWIKKHVKQQLKEDYPSEEFDNKYQTQLSHKWKGEELLNTDEIRAWQRIKSNPLSQDKLDKIDKIFNIIVDKNPELKQLPAKDYQQKIDILHGVESRFNYDDIEYFLSDEHQNASNNYSSLKRRSKIISDFNLDNNDMQWVISPKTYDKIKQHLKESDTLSTKYWALYAHLYDALKKDPDNVYNKLKDKLKGEQLKALEYFYPMAKDQSLLKESKNLGVLYHFTPLKSLISILKDNELSSRYEVGQGYHISLTRDKNFNKQQRIIQGVGCRIKLDGDKLSENYKIKSFNDKHYSHKKTDFNIHQSFEAEERVYTRKIADLDKYVISYDIFVDKSELEYFDVDIDADNEQFSFFKKFVSELNLLSQNPKVNFYLGNKLVSWDKIEDYYDINKQKQVAETRKNKLYNLALRKDPKALTWLGQSILKETLEKEIKYDAWVVPDEKTLKREYHVEHELKGRNDFPTEESFLQACKKGKIEEITPEKDELIHYRLQTKDYDELLGLIKTFKSYPEYRNENTLKGLYQNIKENKPLDLPIVLEFSNGSRRILAGNTRMNVAFQLGVNPKVLVVKVPDKNLNESLEEYNETKLIDPLFKGSWRNCFENARKEFWIRKEKGEDVKYCLGFLEGDAMRAFPNWKGPDKIEYIYMNPIIHAFVLLDNKYIVDSTPFKVGYSSNTSDDRDVFAKEYFKKAKYKIEKFIPEEKLKNEFKIYSDVYNNIIKENVDKRELDSVESQADQQLPIDVKFSDHFFQRLNDPRNQQEIYVEELFDFFDHLSNYKDKFVDFLKKYKQIVVTDNKSHLNIPFALATNRIIAKTIMRKNHFTSPDPKLQIAEGKNVGTLYHFTIFEILNTILETNKLKPSDGEHLMPDLTKYVSLTRDKNLNKWAGWSKRSVRLVLDGNKLSNNYKIEPYNFWLDRFLPNKEWKGLKKMGYKSGYVESEERIKGEIKNLDKYVISYDIFLDKLFETWKNTNYKKQELDIDTIFKLKDNPKVHFYYQGKPTDLSQFNVFDQLPSTNVQVAEGKNIGVLYHNTNFYNFLNILKDNKLLSKLHSLSTPKGGLKFGKSINSISFTRDKNFDKKDNRSVVTGVRIKIDGNKLSNNYKITPYNDPDYSIKSGQKRGIKDGNSHPYEAEEIIYFKENDPKPYIDNFDQYVISYDVNLNRTSTSLESTWKNLESLVKNPKVNFYYDGKLIDNNEWLKKEYPRLKAEKRIAESKQVGDVYHFTSISNLLQILADNKLSTGDISFINNNDGTISTTRDKNFVKRRGNEPLSISGDDVALVLDGDKLSNKYKVRPYDYGYDQNDKYVGDEQEELWYGKKINQQGGIRNLNKYIKGIIFTPKFSYKGDFLIPLKYNFEDFILKYEKEGKLKKVDVRGWDNKRTYATNKEENKEIIEKIIHKELPNIKIDYQN